MTLQRFCRNWASAGVSVRKLLGSGAGMRTIWPAGQRAGGGSQCQSSPCAFSIARPADRSFTGAGHGWQRIISPCRRADRLLMSKRAIRWRLLLRSWNEPGSLLLRFRNDRAMA